MIRFHTFNRWAAISIDGEPMGYMSHFEGVTELHLKKNAPKWLQDVRGYGTFSDRDACQAAIKHAMPIGDLIDMTNVVQMPVRT